jgi:hypothetical protein
MHLGITYLGGPMEFYKLTPREQVRLLAYDRVLRAPSAAQEATRPSPEEQARRHAMETRVRALQAKRGQ